MALKLLLADDSMTAQNMGKKILTEAGYEVVTVSNGAAAVKKIAELKPDLCILDVYMPGYTGLEVCERVKGAQETAKMPVLLTVGKLEPFKAEDGNRVRADGVIIKPFEATDLVAAVQKISAKVEAPPPPPAAEPPVYERTVKMAPLEEDSSYAEWHATAEHHVEGEEAAAKEKIAIPEDMSGSAAIGMDLLEPAAPPAETPARSTVALEEPAAMAAAAEVPAESFSMPMPAAEAAAEPAAAPAHFELETFGSAEPAVAAPPPAELEHTAAPAVGEVAPARPEGFETTAAEAERRHVAEIEPLLVTNSTEMATEFPTKFGVEGAEVMPVGIASEVPGLYADEQAAAPAVEELPAEPALESAPEPAMEVPAEAPAPPADDFEAMVAARLAAEKDAEAAAVEAEPAPPAEPAPTWQAHEEQVEHHEASASLEAEMQNAYASAAPEPAPQPVIEPQPVPAHAEPEPSLAEEMQRAFANLPVEPAPAEPAPEAEPQHELAAAVAAAAGASASAAVADAVSTGTQKLDTAQIAQIAEIVHRVTERLKSEILAEIAKEFENKK